MKKTPIKTIVAIGIGAAIFFVLGRFVAIPSPIPNTTINIQYAVLALFAVMYGPVAGLLIGLIGHTLIDLSWGSPWWSWIIASAVVGLVIGFAAKKIDLESGNFGKKEIITFNVVQIIANAVAFLLVAPGLDILIYAEPADKVFAQGIFAGIMNAVSVAIVGTLLMIAYAKTRTKKGSLSKE
ncbi:ECF-type riboflavin transporter substrate-binding protein [Hydrogenoanaerobacterium sp.]|uniref:ECF-type riboflavin transporter substrate-binding protein n=1 Tax=Hydrogenoanaerobacterium sp. TaxID=2953763 RepID=UPI00289D4339|nr:ECF-type riboflavin transporter substrate-binding protein [Hydrogenoanaerobacterium sp.]